ncbi:MAG: coproporphyrinogen III oxidase, anaerobic, oxygen-independent coproporphyrinogen III oxidase [Candidatus Rokubacteria bacterium CSP1-6]|nr:MAG: coproporphyrinogen III oxidase, anaerobic, oxygen-independent coproporphyrinogen III oxidase [Candidatus Rokubacteria bacterium CSP1-6]
MTLAWSPSRRGPLGVYLHIPFCRQRCSYCSFNTGPYHPAAMDRFHSALLDEIDLVGEAAWAGDVTIGTVFFGGGTPSLLEPIELETILDRLRKRFALDPGAEVTVECNPESLTRAKAEGYRLAGVNRLSLGVQSLDDELLVRLGRLHSSDDARRAFDAARSAGVDNVSLDLMYGLPGQDVARWESTVRGVLAWRPEHLSAYALTLDEGSRWAGEGVAGLPGEETVTAQYWALARMAREAGYEHYEISNYARRGFRSRHNQVYWRAEEYLALGPGACGFLGDVRYGNVKPVERYCTALEAGGLPLGTHEVLTPAQRKAEKVILGLRLSDGVPLAWLEDARSLVETWASLGLLEVAGDRCRLTEAGFLLSDSLFVHLL